MDKWTTIENIERFIKNHMSDDEIITLFNDYCAFSGRPIRIECMDSFNDVFADLPAYNLAWLIWNAGDDFRPDHNYFINNEFSITTFDHYNSGGSPVDISAIAEAAVEHDNDFYNSYIRDMLNQMEA